MLLSLVVLGVIIVFHEFGHYLFAKIFNVKVLKFSVGLGPRLLSKKIGETEYALSLIPLGGYVKMDGEWAGGEKSPDERSYDNKPRWQRIIILLAGPAFNFIFGFLLVVFTFSTLGLPAWSNQIASVQEKSPAAMAGLRSGDKIKSINGIETETWQEIIDNVTPNPPDKELVIVIERDNSGQTEVKVKPYLVGGRSQIGIAAGTSVVARKTDNPIRESITYSIDQLKLLRDVLYGIVSGQISATDSLSGPITIINQTSQTKSEFGWLGLLLLAAVLNFNLGVLNLLPIPVLDGGNIAILLVESMIRKPLGTKLRWAVQGIGLFLIIALMFFAIFLDINRLLN